MWLPGFDCQAHRGRATIDQGGAGTASSRVHCGGLSRSRDNGPLHRRPGLLHPYKLAKTGVAQCWETHGTWKRWPILIDRRLLDPPESGLQVVEGRTRVGVLRGRHRQGILVAERHLAWVGRQQTSVLPVGPPEG